MEVVNVEVVSVVLKLVEDVFSLFYIEMIDEEIKLVVFCDFESGIDVLDKFVLGEMLFLEIEVVYDELLILFVNVLVEFDVNEVEIVLRDFNFSLFSKVFILIKVD